MRLRRLGPALLAGALLLLFAALPAWALTVQGRVLDQAGRPLAGAYLSDGVAMVVSGPDGAYSLETSEERLVALTAPPGYATGARWWWPAGQAARLGQLRLAAAPLKDPAHPRLVVLSDPHLYDAAAAPAWAGKLDPSVPLRTWRAVAGQVTTIKPDLTLLLGDLAMNADRGDTAYARSQLSLAARAAAQLSAPWRACPGNHDVRYGEGRVDRSLWRELLGPTRSLSFLGPVAVILLDNPGLSTLASGKPRPCGILPEEALTWLRAVAALLPPDTPIIVGSHYPLASPLVGAGPLGKGALVKAPSPAGLALRSLDQNGFQALRLLAGHPLVALLSGHLHAANQAALLGRDLSLSLWGAPALCGRWWQGDLRHGPVAFPPAYLRGKLARGERGWSLELSQVIIQPAEPRP